MQAKATVVIPLCSGATFDTRPRPNPLVMLIASLSCLCVAFAAHATPKTYYIDNQALLASPSGPGTLLKPFSTISSALAAHPDTQATFVVFPGTYRERVSVPASGAAAHPILIRTESGSVVIDGADDFAKPELWELFAGGVWKAASVDWAPVQVFADGVRLTPSTQPPATLPIGEFVYVAGSGLFVNVGGGNPAAHGLAVGHRSHGFLVSGKANIFIDGFRITRCEEKGIEVLNSQHVIVRHNVVDKSAGGGIGAETSTGVQVYANTVSDNNHHGILFRVGVSASRIDYNESFANFHVIGEAWATGIYLAGSPGNVIEGNRVHDNQDSGIEVQTGSNDNIVRQNMSWANGDHGFAMLYATGTRQVGNVAWGNAHEAYSVEGNASDTRVYNCIALNRGLNPNTYCLFVDSTSTTGFNGDYNLLWNSVGAPPVRFGNDIYASLGAFQAATSMELHSIAADPRFVNPSGGDFHLQPDSPAIDAATSSVDEWCETDADGRDRSDVPDKPNMGAGPVSFADLGALEYQATGVLAVGGRTSGAGLYLSAAFPNPSRKNVGFALDLPTASEVSWSVFDVLGREVWGGRAAMASGRNELRWTLSDRSGARVPNGVYMVRVNRGRESSTLRFVVIQ